MPYIYKENLEDTEVAVDVIERDIADSIAEERDKAITERDNALKQIESLKEEIDLQKKKFADVFLNPRQSSIPDNSSNKDTVTQPVSYKSLFGME